MQLYLDMDGVLADFDKRAKEILGMSMMQFEEEYGSRRAWARLQSSPDFYNSFDLMPDAMLLFNGVKHLNPIILTGVPLGDWAIPQKVAWCARFFPETSVICCRSKEKSNYCNPGDFLVDDRVEYKHLWEAKGGHYVVHTDAITSLEILRVLGVLR